MLARSHHEGSFEMKFFFSFPFSMTVLNRFLSQVYLKENSHHNVIEEIFSRKVEKCHHRERVLKEHSPYVAVVVTSKGSQVT
jgi:hypothetical protein